LLDLLRKTPIVEVVCAKVGISKATFYNWKRDDLEFAKQIDEAMSGGKDFVSDLAESKVISSIQEGNLQAAVFWLRNHRDDYQPYLKISGEMRHVREELTEDETELLRETLKLAGFSPDQLLPPEEKDITNDNKQKHV